MILHNHAAWHAASWALLEVCELHSFPGPGILFKWNVNRPTYVEPVLSEIERYFFCKMVSIPPLLPVGGPIKELFASAFKYLIPNFPKKNGNEEHASHMVGNSCLVAILTLKRFFFITHCRKKRYVHWNLIFIVIILTWRFRIMPVLNKSMIWWQGESQTCWIVPRPVIHALQFPDTALTVTQIHWI